jgi:hypothetical protein
VDFVTFAADMHNIFVISTRFLGYYTVQEYVVFHYEAGTVDPYHIGQRIGAS